MKAEKKQLDTEVVKQFGEYLKSFLKTIDLPHEQKENLVSLLLQAVCNENTQIITVKGHYGTDHWEALSREDELTRENIQWIKDNLDVWDIQEATRELTVYEVYTTFEKKNIPIKKKQNKKPHLN